MKMIERADGESDDEYEARKAELRQRYLERRRAYYAAHADKLRAACREYRKNHLEQIKARERRFYHDVVKKREVKCNLKQRDDETPEAFAARVEAYMEKRREIHRAYRKKNADRIKKTAKLYYEKNRSRISEQHKKYLRDHYEEQKAKNDARRAAKAASSQPKPRKPPLTIEERRKRSLARYYANRDSIAVKRKARYLKNRNKELAKEKQYRESHREKFEQYRLADRENSRKKAANWFSSKLDGHVDATKIYGVVYLFSNVCTDRFYVGQTVCLKKRYYKGVRSFIEDSRSRVNSLVLEDLDTFGEESFSGPDLIAVAYSKEELDFLESHYIKVYDSFRTGYNKTNGNIKSVERKIRKGTTT